jgi:UDP-N-acetylglucosamine 2-epimerase (non-hydrolysing)
LGDFATLAHGCPGREDPHAHVGDESRALQQLLRSAPDLLVVQGDTSSALGGALAGFVARVPVAHVEAGLRTHDPSLPWPEEEYRTAIDADADLLFAPTELAAANLRAEGVPGEVHVTGNSGIDALLQAVSRLPPRSLGDSALRRLLVTCHRRESWEEGLASIAGALAELAGPNVHIDFVLHPNPHVAANMRRLLGRVASVRLQDPCGHQELLRLMRAADLVLSDSGGIQEEAPALGVPLLVLREKTERPEGVAVGNSRLVGTDRDRIVSEVRRLLVDPAALAAMSFPAFPFGDGRAAARIAYGIMSWLQQRSLTRRLA